MIAAFTAAFWVELLKLRRSLALMLVVAAPTALCGLALAILLDRDRPMPWPMYADGTAAIWAYFMLPMAATALSVLLAQIEHGPRTWDHLLALPGWRGRLFAAKYAVLLVLVAAMAALMWAGTLASGLVADAIGGGALLTGGPPVAALAARLARMGCAGMLVCLLQLWLALRVKSFVPPLVLGIAGTLVGVVATSAKHGIYVPWLLSVNMLSTPDRAGVALAVGTIGTLALLPAMLWDLSRRERIG